MPSALLFDLDGTLIDSAPDLATAVNLTRADFNLAPASESEVRSWVGNGAAKLIERAFAEQTRVEIDEALTRFLAHYQSHCCERTVLYTGVAAALEHWHDLPKAIVTNKPLNFTHTILKGLNINHYFEVVLGGDSVKHKKPNPEMLLRACESLSVEPEQALMIGDSRNDVEAARNASMPVYAVSYGYNHGAPVSDCQPDKVVDDFAELIDLV